jgi:hypothetical protein
VPFEPSLRMAPATGTPMRRTGSRAHVRAHQEFFVIVVEPPAFVTVSVTGCELLLE